MSKKKKFEEKKKKAAIYCRVSTFEQGQGEVSSLNGQEDLLRDYCKRKEWEVNGVYIDKASGSSLKRNEIIRLLSDAEDKKFDIVLATKIDRISRSVLDYLDVDKKLTELGIDIVFATQDIDTTTYDGKFRRNIMLSFAEFERDMIAERTREKLFYQASKGYWGGGHAPLGYDVKNKLLEINSAEALLVNKIYDYYLEELSVEKVAKRLNREGFNSKSRTTKSGKVTGGGLFNKDSVHRVITNKIYIGKITYKKQEFKGLHSPIVDETKFHQVNKQLNVTKNDRFTSQVDSELLLLGRLKCGFCGSNLTTSFVGKKDGTKDFYYKCTTKFKYGSSKCESRDIHASEIEVFIETLIKKIASSDQLFKSVFSQLGHNESKDLKTYETQKNSLIANLNNINKEINNLTSFIAKGSANDFKSVKLKLEELENQKEMIKEERRKVEHEISLIKNTVVDKSDLKQIFKDLSKYYDAATKEERKYMIKTIIREITIKLKKKEEKGTIEIHFRGDGHIKKEWVNRIVNPDKIVSSYYLDWLREQDSNLQPFG